MMREIIGEWSERGRSVGRVMIREMRAFLFNCFKAERLRIKNGRPSVRLKSVIKFLLKGEIIIKLGAGLFSS